MGAGKEASHETVIFLFSEEIKIKKGRKIQTFL
jgi:hypothetical protein